MNATDRVKLNIGGTEFSTTKTTLIASGSGFFQALFETGRLLAGGGDATDLFLDRDGSMFQGILYFMRSGLILPETSKSWAALVALKTEAEFFAYDKLIGVCDSLIQPFAAYANRTPAKSHMVVLPKIGSIKLAEDQMLYIVSATLGGKCSMTRYGNYPTAQEIQEKVKDVPGCYLKTANEGDTGDFQLLASVKKVDGENKFACIAHVGYDHIHCSNVPVNYDFRQDLRVCLLPNVDGVVILKTVGSGDWHVHYWVGHPEDIPGLEVSSYNLVKINH